MMNDLSAALELAWLPYFPGWDERLVKIATAADSEAWHELVALANARIDYATTLRLDRTLRRRFSSVPGALTTRPLRLAILGSSTVEHLFPGIRTAALRRGLWVEIQTVEYGQYQQALLASSSSLHAFRPDVVLFIFDAPHLLGGGAVNLEAVCGRVRELWQQARAAFGCQVIQQTLLPTALALLGSNEHRLTTSALHLTKRFNEWLRTQSDVDGVDLLALDDRAAVDGLLSWHDPVMWLRAKQEVTPLAAPFYGELLARMLAAQQGRSFKCLVLDLDNTLWGGVIGDDGIEGIKLGQGSAVGEAHLAVQRYAMELSRRGIILAVCSKNDEEIALSAFEHHPEMLLRRSDIACFIANWEDKATNLRRIASSLNLGLDSLVLLDDSPFERSLVRGALPMVAVPELPEDPALYPRRLADAGYFETVSITDDDLLRSRQYQAGVERETMRTSAADLQSYLAGLQMELFWGNFNRIALQRIVQLINKTNQFNLTTRRYTAAEVQALMSDPLVFTLQLRLVDCYGDNGIISVIIGRLVGDVVELDTWLMSCRVLGRDVEKAALNIVVEQARQLGGKFLRGIYRPTEKNEIVRGHYAALGFHPDQTSTTDEYCWTLPLDGCVQHDICIKIQKIE